MTNLQYFHQAGFTDDYFIFPFTNMAFHNLTCTMTQVMKTEPLGDCMEVHEEFDAQFVVFNRHSMTEVGRFKMDYFIGLHIINSYQVGNKIILDYMTMKDDVDPFQMTHLSVANATGQAQLDNYNNFGLLETTPARIELDLDQARNFENINVYSKKLFDSATDNDQ